MRWTFLLFGGKKMARTTRHLNLEWLNFNNKSSNDYPILVNTTGYCDVLSPFETHNPVGRDDYYLIYIIEGELSLDIADAKHISKKGSAIIFPPKYKYKYSGNHHTYYLYAHFTDSYAADFLKECDFDNLPCIIENDFSTEIEKKFDLMINTFLHNEQLSIQKCACLLQEILLDIRLDALDKANDSPIKASLKYIHSNFTSKIDVPYLASIERLSNSRYLTVFKQQTGKSPNRYIIDLRMQFAKKLLDNTNMSIRQISENVGYNDQYFFSRLFKKHMGISPQAYRNKNKF